ncbi:DUF4093 domain-containing protein, partial [Staphylococcus saprophyticus]
MSKDVLMDLGLMVGKEGGDKREKLGGKVDIGDCNGKK